MFYLVRKGYARISHGGLSDTELQMARFKIPSDSKNYRDNKKIVFDTANVSKDSQFSEK